MKKFLFFTMIFAFIFFMGCPFLTSKPATVTDPLYAYNVIMNVLNESSSDIEIAITSYTVHNDEKNIVQLEGDI